MRFSLCVLCVVWVGVVWAASPVDVYHFDSPEQQTRYKGLIDEFRCPKCVNTNIAGSDAPIAQDLRAAVHRLIVVEGLSDDEIRAYMHQRYGDFVLYDPPFTKRTSIIWLTPIMLGLIVVGVLLTLLRRSSKAAQVVLDADDRDRLKKLFNDS